jgi:hypothetical protein
MEHFHAFLNLKREQNHQPLMEDFHCGSLPAKMSSLPVEHFHPNLGTVPGESFFG